MAVGAAAVVAVAAAFAAMVATMAAVVVAATAAATAAAGAWQGLVAALRVVAPAGLVRRAMVPMGGVEAAEAAEAVASEG